MKSLSKKLRKYIKLNISIILIFFISNSLLSNEILIKIEGNKFTDDNAILSLIENRPEDLSDQYANYLIKTLDNSMLFENVSVKVTDKEYIISIIEYPNIKKIFFSNNERLKDEELLDYSNQLKLTNLNKS